MYNKSMVLCFGALTINLMSIVPTIAYSVHKPYKTHITRYYPHRAHTARYYRSNQTAARGGYGLATFYDPGPGGRGFTVAHRSLPFGTNLKVTNLYNGQTVVVRVADRGPEAWTGRDLDLSRTAARALGMIQTGVVRVAYQVLER